MRRDDHEATWGISWAELTRLAAALALFATLLWVTPSREPTGGDSQPKPTPDATKAGVRAPAIPVDVVAPPPGPAELTGSAWSHQCRSSPARGSGRRTRSGGLGGHCGRILHARPDDQVGIGL